MVPVSRDIAGDTRIHCYSVVAVVIREDIAKTEILEAKMNECPRGHGFPYSPPKDYELPFWVRRCAHFGNRFIVDIKNEKIGTHFVDFVEDLPDGEVFVEGDYADSDAQADAKFNALRERLLSGDAPISDGILAGEVMNSWGQDK